MKQLGAFRNADLRAKKRLGQHFLKDPQAVARIIEAATIGPDDTVVEVGAGPGILTPALAERAGRVVAIELDQDVLPVLQEAMAQFDTVEIRNEDVLGIDPADLPQPYQVVANLPYYITSAVIRHFLEAAARPRSMTLTIQQEVAERIVATPPKMSVLAVSVQLYGRPEIVAAIGRNAFWPVPAVDSAVLRIDRIGQGLEQRLQGVSEEGFFKVVRAGFSEKRKQLHNALARNLGLSHGAATALLERVGIDPARRAETLTVEDWVRVARAHV